MLLAYADSLARRLTRRLVRLTLRPVLTHNPASDESARDRFLGSGRAFPALGCVLGPPVGLRQLRRPDKDHYVAYAVVGVPAEYRVDGMTAPRNALNFRR